MNDITIRIAEKSYSDDSGSRRPVLADIALRVPSGAVWVLFGPSGCGKTTLLRLVAGLDADFTGSIAFADGTRPPRPGFVFQEPRLLPWASARDNVALVLDGPGIADRAEAALAAVGLADQAGQRPGQLSGGQQRRVALARALAGEPDLLLLDEPFASLDRETARAQRRHLIAVLRQRPVTTLLVTHDREEALQLADRVLLLDGRPAGVRKTIDIPEHARRRDDLAIEPGLLDQLS